MATTATMVTAHNIKAGVWHTVEVRGRHSAACTTTQTGSVFPETSAQWFEYINAPGEPAVHVGPPPTTSSAYGVFSLNTTAPPDSSWFQYSLDGSTWNDCGANFSLGPLSTGDHVLLVRTINTDRSEVSDSVAHRWSIVPTADSLLSFRSLSEGHHRLIVAATDPVGHVQLVPTSYDWIVDVTPPLTVAALSATSSYYTNASAVNTAVACDDESLPSLCTYCVRVTVSLHGVPVDSDTSFCSLPGVSILTVPLHSDGDTEVTVTALDAANNRGNDVVVQVVHDTTPPTTVASIVSVTSWVAAVQSFVMSNDSLSMVVSANESLSSAVVQIAVVSESTGLPNNSSVQTIVCVDGFVNVPLHSMSFSVVTVQVIDLAGNIDPVGTPLRVVAIASPPRAIVSGIPSSVTNVSTIVLVVTAVEADVRLVNGFALEWQTSVIVLPVLPVFLSIQSVDLTLRDLPSGRYTVFAAAVDVLNRTGSSSLNSFTVDTEPPQSWFENQLPSFVSSTSLTLNVTGVDSLSLNGTVLSLLASTDDSSIPAEEGWMPLLPPLAPSEFSVTRSWVGADLVQGRHIFAVRGVDGAGNVQQVLDRVITVVDTVPPVLNFTTSSRKWTNVVNFTVCVSVTDATAGVAQVVVNISSPMNSSALQLTAADEENTLPGADDNMAVPVTKSGCCAIKMSKQTNYSVLVTANDLANNAAREGLGTWIVLDTTPPSHSLQLVTGRGCATKPVGAQGVLTVCNGTAAALFHVVCNNAVNMSLPEADFAIASPCTLWAAAAATMSGACGQDNGNLSTSVTTWKPLEVVSDVAVVTAAALLGSTGSSTSLRGEYVAHSQARDEAGNADGDVSMLWWIDSVAPAPPRMTSTPAGVSTDTTATFEFQLMNDNSIGQLSFEYTLSQDDAPYTGTTGSNPVIPDPTPTNNDVSQLVISGLAVGHAYSITVWSVTHAGMVSTVASTFAWQVVASAPALIATSKPDAESGSSVPTFHFVVDWGATGTAIAASINISVALLGDPDLASFHTPLICRGVSVPVSGDSGQSAESGYTLGSQELLGYGQRDCIAGDCSSQGGCDYAVNVPSSGAHILQARAVLSGSAGSTLVLQWSRVECSTTQYGMISGNDTLTCAQCPAGGDCSSSIGNTSISTGSVSTVTQFDIVAQAGWWASESANGLTYYPCPIAGACLRGGNGTRARCASGYMGIACSVCALGYYEQFGKCVLCPPSSGASVGTMFGISLLLAVLCGLLFFMRRLMPVDVLKLGLSMLQVR